MRKQRRWMKWVFEEVDQFQVILPWERGANRKAWRKRLSSTPVLKKIAKG